MYVRSEYSPLVDSGTELGSMLWGTVRLARVVITTITTAVSEYMVKAVGMDDVRLF